MTQSEPTIIRPPTSERGEQRFVIQGVRWKDYMVLREALVSLPVIEAELPLREVYDGVEFIPESDDDPT